MIARLLARLRGPWVTNDPDPQPSQLDHIGGTYETIHTALRRATTVYDGQATLLTDTQLTRAAREVTRALQPDPLISALRADLDADPDLTDDYARKFAGEYGDVAAMRGARLTADERRNDGRGVR